jgi:hypothetical protein
MVAWMALTAAPAPAGTPVPRAGVTEPPGTPTEKIVTILAAMTLAAATAHGP